TATAKHRLAPQPVDGTEAGLGACLHQHDDAKLRDRKLEYLVGLDAAAEVAARFRQDGKARARYARLALRAAPCPFAQGVAIGVARILAPDRVMVTLRVAARGVVADQLYDAAACIPAAARRLPGGGPRILRGRLPFLRAGPPTKHHGRQRGV